MLIAMEIEEAIPSQLAQSNHTRLAPSRVTLSVTKGLNRQIFRFTQNDKPGESPRKVYECFVVRFRWVANRQYS